VYREGLAERLDGHRRFTVTRSVATGTQCVDAAYETRPDQVLLDVGAPAAETAMRALTRPGLGVRVVALAIPDVEAEVLGWVARGASGFVTAEDSLEELFATLESVGRGEGRCSPRMIGALLRSVAALSAERDAAADLAPAEPLTARELEIGGLVEAGLSNKEIARRLSIQLPTVKNHVHNLLRKLHVGRRSEAGARLRALGLVPVPLRSRD
jgi:DNA-binding NarL/FixJ family response regulator